MGEFTEGQKAILAELAETELKKLLEVGGYLPAHQLRDAVLKEIEQKLSSDDYMTGATLEQKAKSLGILFADNVDRGPASDTTGSDTTGASGEGAAGGGGDAATASRPLRIPDRIETEQIAAKAIREWKTAQPKWWDVKARLSARLGAGTAAAVLALAAFDWARETFSTRAFLVDRYHWITGTDDRFDTRFTALAKQWTTNPAEGAARDFDEAFQAKLAGWVQEPRFRERVGGAVKVMADQRGADENPIRDLIVATLDERPLLMFHGSARLNEATPVEVTDMGCNRMVWTWTRQRRMDLLPFRPGPDAYDRDGANDRANGNAVAEPLSSGVRPQDLVHLGANTREFCANAGEIRTEDSFEVPFFARFHKGEDVPPDKVFLVLWASGYISETNKENCRAGEDPEADDCIPVDENGKPISIPVEISDLSIEYNSLDIDLENREMNVVRLDDFGSEVGNFYSARIDEKIKANTIDTSAGPALKPSELIHTISIELSDTSTLADNVGVHVRAIVLVNKNNIN